MIRKTIFWTHLCVGVATGLVIAMMSLTGVLLTYELQMEAWADRSFHETPAPGAARLPLEAIIAAVDSQLDVSQLVITANNEAPVLVRGGRGQDSLYVNPYTAEVLGVPSPRIRQVFSTLIGWHRWFDASRENRSIPRKITGVSNLAFLFLILSGMYLWLPKIMRWPLFRARLLFNQNNKTSKVRDFNWHHVFGLWTSVPLIIVVATAVVFSFSWGSALLKVLAGDSPSSSSRSASVVTVGTNAQLAAGDRLALDVHVEQAKGAFTTWNTISVKIPENDADPVEVSVDQGNGRQPQLREKFRFDQLSGNVLLHETLRDRSASSQARSWVRFLHTGEVFGFPGQTVAGIVSFTSLLMVWTGFALAYRRLVSPLLRRKRVTPPKVSGNSATARKPAN